jgi:hypothetical protein
MVDPAANALLDKCSAESFTTVSAVTAAASADSGPPSAAHPTGPQSRVLSHWSSVTGLSRRRQSLSLWHVGFHAPLIVDISLGLDMLVSYAPFASDVLCGSDALVLALLLSISFGCCVPNTPQVCLSFLPRHCT